MNGRILFIAAAASLLAAGSALAQAKPKAMIVVTSGENQQCSFGSANIGWAVVIRHAFDAGRATRKYITSLDNHCVIVPVTAPIGTRIDIGGLLEGRSPSDNLSGLPGQPTVAEQCFNIEAYSIGLSDDPSFSGPELNPLDPANIVNDQGFGLFWEMDDGQGPFDRGSEATFTVTGCGAGLRCKLPTSVFNTDTGLTDTSGCAVLAPLS